MGDGQATPASLDLDAGPEEGYPLGCNPVDHDQLVASRRARNEANRATRDVQLVGQEAHETRVGGTTDSRSRYPSLKHALLRDAVYPIHSAARHQPHRESDRR